MIRVVIVGATGSIGRSALDVLRALGPEVELTGAFSGRRTADLAQIAREWNVTYAGVADPSVLPALRQSVPETVRTGTLKELLSDAIADPRTDLVLNAATGAAGLPASVETIRQGKTLALANKESMVMAGPLLMRMAQESGSRILPVDSEHSAIFQALRAGQLTEVRKVILTASGGPFRNWSAERMATASPEAALDHPTWSMGPKISIDSATLMNKALELVEARWLFGLEPERIDAVVHPQSVVHSMVEFVDGSIVAQMGRPDMRLPIQYALTYPERRGPSVVSFDLKDFARLDFEEVDRERFPGFAVGERAMRMGGTAGAVFNAANEVAVARFLEGKIPFPAIAATVAAVLDEATIVPDPGLDDIFAADRAAREDAATCRT